MGGPRPAPAGGRRPRTRDSSCGAELQGCQSWRREMSDEPDNLVLRMLRRIDEKLDRVLGELSDIKPRLTSLERQMGDFRVDMAGQAARLDRIDVRLDRIERRVDIVNA